MKTLLLNLFIALNLAAVPAAFAETPQEAAKAIHGLIEAKDYKTLLSTRYSEWHKVAKEGVDPEKAVTKISGMFEKKSEVLLSIYAQLQSTEFEMGENEHAQKTETGKTATAKVKLGDKEIPFTLYEMKGGKWGFHL